MRNFLKNCQQLVQIINNFSSSKNVHAGIPQGLIDELLLFNLFLNDLRPFMTNTFLRNYADESNLYSIENGLDLSNGMLHKDFRVLTEWFYDN